MNNFAELSFIHLVFPNVSQEIYPIKTKNKFISPFFRDVCVRTRSKQKTGHEINMVVALMKLKL